MDDLQSVMMTTGLDLAAFNQVMATSTMNYTALEQDQRVGWQLMTLVARSTLCCWNSCADGQLLGYSGLGMAPAPCLQRDELATLLSVAGRQKSFLLALPAVACPHACNATGSMLLLQ